MKQGIYKITNIKNNKSYVGLSKHIERRIKEHFVNQRNLIGLAIKKHGKESFKWEILELCEKDKLEEREVYWISKFNSVSPNGYNLTSGGEVSKEYSEETKKKMSDIQIAMDHTGNRNTFYGKKHSEETKRIIGEKARKRCENPEYRKRISDSRKGTSAWNKGIDHIPQEQRRKSAASFSKKVICIELKKEFPSITAALRFLQSQGKSAKSRGNIIRNIRGGSPAYGYNWKYINKL